MVQHKFQKVEKVVVEKEPVNLKARSILTIDLANRNKPDFSYQGAWAAKDVRVVLRGIIRSYRQYQQNLRRQLAPVSSEQTQEQPVLLEGVK